MFRKHNNIPKLSKITEDVIKIQPKTPEELKKLLEPKKKLELEDDLSLSGSDISDAFEDLHRQSLLCRKDNYKKHLTKTQIDWETMSLFTEEFKKTMAEVRKELKLDTNMMKESPEEIFKILREKRETKEIPQEKPEDVSDEFLKDYEYIRTHVDDTMVQTLEKVKCDSDMDMSDFWKMTIVHDTGGKFKITQPGFNAYRQNEPHWLDRSAVPRETLKFSKSKCEDWLEKYN